MLTLEQTDIDIPCRIALTWTRHYSTAFKDAPSPFGLGWRTEYSATLKKDIEGFTFVSPEGDETNFDDNGELEAGGVLIHFGAYRELFRRGNDYVVSLWDIDSGVITRYVFRPGPEDESWPVHRIEDVTGQGTTVLYKNGLIDAVVESRGNRRLQVEYNGQSLVAEVWVVVGQDYRRRLARFEYDPPGRLVAAYDAAETPTSYQYDLNNRLVREVARDGGVFFFAYDRKGRCVKTRGLDDYDAQTIVYHEEALLTEVTDSGGGTWLYKLRNTGQVAQVVSPLGSVNSFEYDSYGRIIAEIDANGAATRYEFDRAGNRSRVENALGQADEFTHNEYRRPISHKDRAGNTRLREYDGLSRLVAAVEPTGARWEYAYNSEGDLVSATNPRGARKLFGHNLYGDLIRQTDWEGSARLFERDMEGRITKEVDALGYAAEVQRDARGNVSRVVLPDGSAWRLTFDSEGNLREQVDPNNRRTVFRYGPCDRLAQVEYLDGTSLQLRWSTIPGQVVQVTNEAGETYHYYYDADGRLAREVGFDGGEFLFEYDAAGWCTGVTDNARRTTRFERDALGRITKKIFYDGETATFAYDALGDVVRAENVNGGTFFERDALGRIVREGHGSHWVESEYDVLGNRVGRRTDLGHKERFLRDSDGRLSQLDLGGWGDVRFKRDAEGQELERRYNDRMACRQEYDYGGRLSRQWLGVSKHQLDLYRPGDAESDSSRRPWSADAVLLDRTFKYVPAGRLTEVADARADAVQYTYDSRWRLNGVARAAGVSESYQLDRAGNVVSAEYARAAGLPRHERYSYASGGRVVAKNDTRYEYDGNGQTIRKIEGADSPSLRVWEYEWDSGGLLKSVKRPDGEIWRYFYDPFGRRIRKEGPGRVVEFVWDEYVPAHEIHNETDPVTWVFEDASFRPLGKVEKGSAYFCINDQVGAPRELLSSNGEIAWASDQTAWGRGLQKTGGRGECPVRFQGQWYDEESGLCYNWFRYYDPERSAYISKDPSGLLGSLHLYNYPRDPLRYIDPHGLVPLDEGGFSVYGLYHPGAQNPYYVGITNDVDRRMGEHVESGRRPEDGRYAILSEDLTYAQARGQEQAYMEHYGTKQGFPQNEINSFRHERTDDRGLAFEAEYQKKKRALRKRKRGCKK
ncbi:MAG: RHS repeat protein [Acidobacteria bacterium]|nr:RHS repeat protein [Acidobacteriota bacterium]